MKLKSKTLKAIADTPFKLPNAEGVYKIKPMLSSFFLEKDGVFHGSIIPWISTNDKLHITFRHCGNLIESKIKLKELIFINPLNKTK